MTWHRRKIYVYSIPANDGKSFVNVSDSCISGFEYIMEFDIGGNE